MALDVIRTEYDKVKMVLTSCPICGYDFTQDTYTHSRQRHYLEDHQPEDFGLSPIGER